MALPARVEGGVLLVHMPSHERSSGTRVDADVFKWRHGSRLDSRSRGGGGGKGLLMSPKASPAFGFCLQMHAYEADKDV